MFLLVVATMTFAAAAITVVPMDSDADSLLSQSVLRELAGNAALKDLAIKASLRDIANRAGAKFKRDKAEIEKWWPIVKQAGIKVE